MLKTFFILNLKSKQNKQTNKKPSPDLYLTGKREPLYTLEQESDMSICNIPGKWNGCYRGDSPLENYNNLVYSAFKRDIMKMENINVFFYEKMCMAEVEFTLSYLVNFKPFLQGKTVLSLWAAEHESRLSGKSYSRTHSRMTLLNCEPLWYERCWVYLPGECDREIQSRNVCIHNWKH